MNLANIFIAAAYKKLVQVDLPGGSNQHEINGSSKLRSFFNTSERIQGSIKWHYFSDDQELVQEENTYTFYDARARSADRTNRSEWRMYYYGDFLSYANPDDILVLLKTKVQEEAYDIYGLVFQANSRWSRAVGSLLILDNPTSTFSLISHESLNEKELELTRYRILDELGIEFVHPTRKDDESLVVEKFGMEFPKTKVMSQFAQEQVEVNLSDADETLMRWLTREEELFIALERVIVQERLNKGFDDVDAFLKFSLSVHNTRKSRMGYAFQNHLSRLFDENHIRYTAQGVTEGKIKPDFLFPGRIEYHQASFDAQRLVMLAAKSTCKDRWRQVLTEAARIPVKHLCTLEPGISVNQTDEMKGQNIKLVIPRKLLEATYTKTQQQEAMILIDFIEFVRSKQI